MNRHRQSTLLVTMLVGLALMQGQVGSECRSCCPGEGAPAPVVSSLGCCGDDCARLVSGQEQPALASSKGTTAAAPGTALLAPTPAFRFASLPASRLAPPLALVRSAPTSSHTLPLRL
ncbi:MAG: hypothetical protein ACRD1B_01735 [Thermoanaerobaculia bacterium]